MPSIRESESTPQAVNPELLLPTAFPSLPSSMRKRFGGEAEEYDDSVRQWWSRTKRALNEAQGTVAQEANTAAADLRNVRKEFVAADAVLTAAFDENIQVLVNADEALAERTTTLEASVNGPSTGLLARVSTIESAYASRDWAEAKILEEVTASEARTNLSLEALATADGHLSGKATLAVSVGNVVTGINITSTTDDGENINEIVFQTDRLKVRPSGSSTVKQLLDLSTLGFIFGADLISDGFVSGVSGWRFTKAGQLEANDGWFRGTLDSAVIGTSGLFISSYIGLRYVHDGGVFTITGGSDNGDSHGAQIDLSGNGLPTWGGALSLSAGNTATGNIRLRTGGTERMTIENDGGIYMHGPVNVDSQVLVGGLKVLGPRYSTAPATLADVIAVLKHHGLCPP